MTKSIAILALTISALLVAAAVTGIHGYSLNIYDYDATISVDVAGF